MALALPPHQGTWRVDFDALDDDHVLYVEAEERYTPYWPLTDEQRIDLQKGRAITFATSEPYRLMWPKPVPGHSRHWVAGPIYVRVDAGSGVQGVPHFWRATDWHRREAWGGLMHKDGSAYPWITALYHGDIDTKYFTSGRGDVWAARRAQQPEGETRPFVFLFERIH